MKLTKVFWACSPMLLPAAIVPAAASCACSQNWGYKTPISIGTTVKETSYQDKSLDPYARFADRTDLVDLNGNPVVSQLQSAFAVDVANSQFYGYSIPEKWNNKVEIADEIVPSTGETIKWNKGAFTDGSLGWYPYSSDSFVVRTTRSGKKYDAAGTKQVATVSDPVISYRNNMQASNIELVSMIGSALSQYFNYALHYQGTQIGSGYSGKSTETDTDLAYAWGQNFTHGAKGDTENRTFYESVFATNAVTGSGKTQAVVRPTHIEFNFVDMPIVGYEKDADGNIAGVHDLTKGLLNGQNQLKRPKEIINDHGTVYWTSKQNQNSTTYYNFRTGEGKGTKEVYKYQVYTYTNVPVLIRFNTFAKTYVNPTKKSGYKVSDFYSSDKTIKNTIGNSWAGSINKFTDGETKPQYSSFQFSSPDGTKASIDPKCEESNKDGRLYDTASKSRVQQNDFIALLNFNYTEVQEADIGGTTVPYEELAKYDTVSMTGFNTLFPAYICDENLQLGANTFFKKAYTKEDGCTVGYVFDSGKANQQANRFLQLVKRTSKEGMEPLAHKLSAPAKELLKFLAYMLGNKSLAVNTADCITATPLAAE